MSKFEELFLAKKEKMTEEVKEQPTPRPQRTRRINASRTAKIDEKLLVNMVTKDDLQTLKNDLLRSLEIQKEYIEKLQVKNQELKQRPIIEFNELTALEYAINRDRKGYKPSTMFDAFRLAPEVKTKQDILFIDNYFKENKYVKVKKNGWRIYTRKGLEHYKFLVKQK